MKPEGNERRDVGREGPAAGWTDSLINQIDKTGRLGGEFRHDVERVEMSVEMLRWRFAVSSPWYLSYTSEDEK